MRHFTFLTPVYAGLTQFRNFLYDWGFADTVQLPCPVVSVGNISVGGTGKTPVVDWLLNYFETRNKNILVVSRNYKAASKGTEKVNLQFPRAPFFYGDEPTWLALRHPMATIYVGPHKWQAALSATMKEKFDLVIVDDGFQHRALHRDFDIVLLDATEQEQDQQLVPMGRSREPRSALERADWIFLTKANMVDEQILEQKMNQLPSGIPYLLFDYELSLPFDLPEHSKLLLVSGLANPHSFEKAIESRNDLLVSGKLHFPDHYAYSSEDWNQLLHKRDQMGADYILTTEKDFIKLKEVAGDSPYLKTATLNLQVRGDIDRFFMEIDLVVG